MEVRKVVISLASFLTVTMRAVFIPESSQEPHHTLLPHSCTSYKDRFPSTDSVFPGESPASRPVLQLLQTSPRRRPWPRPARQHACCAHRYAEQGSGS